MDIPHKYRCEWIAETIRDPCYTAYFLAFLFEPLSGRRLEGGARSWLDEPAPRLFAAPARFVPRTARQGAEDAENNGGLHLRAVLLLPERLRSTAADLQRRAREDRSIRRAARGKLRRVDVERVPPGAEARAAALLLEGLERDPAFEDELLMLP